MNEKNTLKSLLGIAQEEIAIILGITRSHCAMYETKKRSLPLHAKMELVKILQYTEKKEFKNKAIQHFINEEVLRMQKVFEKEIQLNAYKIHVLEKKIKKAERLRNESLAALRLSEYLDSQTDNERTVGMSPIIKSQAMEVFKRNNELFCKYTLRKETLKQQSVLLEMQLTSKDVFSFL
jgi:transcriptional regulator with XRE-family HTH domain